MYKATIKLQGRDGQVYTGGTARAYTLKRAIQAADAATKNEWSLPFWAEVDGKQVHYTLCPDGSGGEEVLILTVMERR